MLASGFPVPGIGFGDRKVTKVSAQSASQSCFLREEKAGALLFGIWRAGVQEELSLSVPQPGQAWPSHMGQSPVPASGPRVSVLLTTESAWLWWWWHW